MRTRAQPLHILPQILRHNPGLKFLFPIALLIGGSRRVTGEARRLGVAAGDCAKANGQNSDGAMPIIARQAKKRAQ